MKPILSFAYIHQKVGNAFSYGRKTSVDGYEAGELLTNLSSDIKKHAEDYAGERVKEALRFLKDELYTDQGVMDIDDVEGYINRRLA